MFRIETPEPRRRKPGKASHRPRSGGHDRARGRARRLAFEPLEARQLLASVPFGAMQNDTAEYMLGDVLVTLVLMESKSSGGPGNAINPNTENWTAGSIAVAKQKVIDAMDWWETTLQRQNSAHELNFQFDFTYADTPVPTDYEPIANISNNFRYWIYDFLNPRGYNTGGSFSNDIKAFNHAQRLAHETNWAFTIFLVNDEHDADGMFKSGGTFSRAFAFPGGEFLIAPAGRPVSTITHETGHIFWARDEYAGAGSYSDRRGYYNSQNTNADDNPDRDYIHTDSIMNTGESLVDAFDSHTSSLSSLEMIGWKDSDHDGIFDVLDVPLKLQGSGKFDPQLGKYHFVGSSSVQTLPNRNSSGLQNDITINRVSRAEFRINGGDWNTAATYDTYQANLDLKITMPSIGSHTIEIRTIDAVSGVTSPVFYGTNERPMAVLRQGLSGFVFNDLDGDHFFDNSESGLAGWTVRLVDQFGTPLDFAKRIEPDNFPNGSLINNVIPDVLLTAIGEDVDGSVASGPFSGGTVVDASTGDQTFYHFTGLGGGWSSSWTPESRKLRIDFSSPTTAVRLDAIGNSAADYGRLEVFDANNQLLARYTTDSLSKGEIETMVIERPTADIAYAIARGHMGTALNLDNLRIGPQMSAVTDSRGAYSLTSFPAGNYRVRVDPPPGWLLSDPNQAVQTVTLAEGEGRGEVNFGAEANVVSWQNPNNSLDVDGNGRVQALDVLQLVNYINDNPGNPNPPPAPATPPPYLDVDGNGRIAAFDVLLVINFLNDPPGDGEGEAAMGAMGFMGIMNRIIPMNPMNPMNPIASPGARPADAVFARAAPADAEPEWSTEFSDNLDDCLADLLPLPI